MPIKSWRFLLGHLEFLTAAPVAAVHYPPPWAACWRHPRHSEQRRRALRPRDLRHVLRTRMRMPAAKG
jgi:hypothetical protein